MRQRTGPIEVVAQCWVDRHGQPGDEYRYDAISVLIVDGGGPVIEHVEDAWRM